MVLITLTNIVKCAVQRSATNCQVQHYKPKQNSAVSVGKLPNRLLLPVIFISIVVVIVIVEDCSVVIVIVIIVVIEHCKHM